MSEKRGGLGQWLGCLFSGYLIVAGLSIPYYNWAYAQRHGFANWLFFGQVVATFQSLAWPYDTYVTVARLSRGRLNEDQRAAIATLRDAIQIRNGAFDLLENAKGKLADDPARVALASAALQDAIVRAAEPSDEVLASIHPELPDQVQVNLIGGMANLVLAITEDDSSKGAEAHKRFAEFGEFYGAHCAGR